MKYKKLWNMASLLVQQNDTTVTAGKGLDFGNKTMEPTRASTATLVRKQTATSPLIKMI